MVNLGWFSEALWKLFASVMKTAQVRFLHSAERSQQEELLEMCLYICPSMSVGLLLGLGSTAQPYMTLFSGVFR